MYQKLVHGRHVWEDISREQLFDELGQTYQPVEFPRIVESLHRGDMEQTANGYLRWWEPGRVGNPAV